MKTLSMSMRNPPNVSPNGSNGFASQVGLGPGYMNDPSLSGLASGNAEGPCGLVQKLPHVYIRIQD